MVQLHGAVTHYTALVKIERVVKTDGTGRGDDRREVEGFTVTVRASSLADLKQKVTDTCS